MTASSLALVLLATALPTWSSAGVPRARLGALCGRSARRPFVAHRDRSGAWLLPGLASAATGCLVGVLFGWPWGAPVGLAAALVGLVGIRRWLRGAAASPSSPADQLALAATWDLLAASLRAGLPVATAVRAVATDLPDPAREALRTTADLLALGADPVAAWAPALDCPQTATLARGARRTARSGTALASVATAVATTIREATSDAAESRAQRAGVLIAGPLGLCFLPAFICLGIVPVVIGLAAQLTVHH